MRLRNLFYLALFLTLSSTVLDAQTSKCDADIVHVNPKTNDDRIQIMIEKGDEDTVAIMSRDFSRGVKEASYSAEGNMYTITPGLAMGENKFDLVFYKAKDLVHACSVSVTRVLPGGSAKSAVQSTSQPTVRNSEVAVAKLAEISRLEVAPLKTDAPPAAEIVKRPPTQISTDNSPAAIPLNLEKKTDTQPPVSAPANAVPAKSAAAANNSGGATNAKSNSENPVRLIFGFEQAGASSTSSKTQPFIDMMATVPVEHFKGIGGKGSYPFSFWTNLRLTSIAGQALPDFGSLTDAAVTGFFGANQSTKINDIVQAFQVRFGLDQSFGKGFSLIAGVGATNPLSPDKTIVAYKIPHVSMGGDATDDFKKIFGPTTDFSKLNTLVLSLGDRNRFNRNWFVGGRLNAHFADDAYPATFELTFGQDEILTNRLIGGVMKFDTFVPIPFKGLKFLYFGGSFTTKLGGKVKTETLPFFLEPATNVNLSGSDIFVRNVRDIPQLISDRDFFSFRFGVDLIELIKGSKKDATAAKPIADY
jgi:hypothetical protein